MRTLATLLDEIANEALHSGDQSILDLVEEITEILGFDN